MDGLTVQGLWARTRNADEAHTSHARIGKLWADFGLQLAPSMALGALTYGVYHHYESDANGLFDVLVGTDAPMPNAPDAPVLSKVDIVAGAYLVFEAKGPMPQAVVQAWAGAQAFAYNTYAIAAKIMAGGKIVRSGGPELALELEKDGYEFLKEDALAPA